MVVLCEITATLQSDNCIISLIEVALFLMTKLPSQFVSWLTYYCPLLIVSAYRIGVGDIGTDYLPLKNPRVRY